MSNFPKKNLLPEETIEKIIQQLKFKLLDTSGRNNLISFKHNEKSRTHIRIINVSPEILFRQIINSSKLHFKSILDNKTSPKKRTSLNDLSKEENFEKIEKKNQIYTLPSNKNESSNNSILNKMTINPLKKSQSNSQSFLEEKSDLNPLKEYAHLHNIDLNYDLYNSLIQRKNIKNKSLQILSHPDSMNVKLNSIYEQFNSSLQETGVNTLYCVFGFLEWFEKYIPEKKYLSPIILVPLEMERKLQQGKYIYSISGIGEEPIINIALIERFRRDYKILLPLLQEKDSPKTYIEKIKSQLETETRNWCIHYFVTIGHFTFTRLVMYNDLNNRKWIDEKIFLKNSIIKKLLINDQREVDKPKFAEEYNIDHKSTNDKHTTLVLNADSSQHSAIIDVINGHNLVIEGPPGTGKSQTITNIIAAAFTSKKNILFIAEKVAALEAAKNRLDKVGLGNFCLELYSTKSKKRDVLDSLHKRLSLQEKRITERQLGKEIIEINRLKENLNNYANLLNSKLGNSNKTIYEILWGFRHLQSSFSDIDFDIEDIKIEKAIELTPSLIEEHIVKLQILEKAYFALQCEVNVHPWNWFQRSDISPFEQEKIINLIRDNTFSVIWLVQILLRFARQFHLKMPIDISYLKRDFLFLKKISIAESDSKEKLFTFYVYCLDKDHRKIVKDWLDESFCIENNFAYIARLGAERAIRRLGPAFLHRQLTIALSYFNTATDELQFLSEKAVQLEWQASELKTAFSYLENIARILFNNGLLRIASCRVILTAITFAMRVDRMALQVLSADILRKDNYNLLCEAALLCENVRKKRKEVGKFFLKDQIFDVSLLQKHAFLLKKSSFFSFINPFLRKSRKFYASIAKFPENNDLLMSERLFLYIEYTELLNKFRENEQIRTVLGRYYWGLETDFSSIVLIANWAKYVRENFVTKCDEDIIIRNALLEGNYNLIEVLQTLGRSSAFERINKIFNSIKVDDGIVNNVINDLVTTSKDVSRIYVDMTNCGFVSTIKASELSEILTCTENILTALDRKESIKIQIDCQYYNLLDRASFSLIKQILIDTDSFLENKPSNQICNFLLREDVYKVLSLNKRILFLEKVLKHITQIELFFDRVENLLKYKLSSYRNNIYDLKKSFQESLSNEDKLSQWFDWLVARNNVIFLGLENFIFLYMKKKRFSNTIKDCYKWILYRSLAEEAFSKYPELSQFSGLNLQHMKERFRELDKSILDLQGQLLAVELCDRPISNGVGQGRKSEYSDRSLIQFEIEKRRKNISIRELLSRAGTAIQEMKPCFMMSPISVAQFLKPGRLIFDLLIIDEASQMRPEDALCSIARCKQLVVVGDSKQLPPSTFFNRLIEESDDLEEEDFQSDSILDLASLAFRPARRLRWHYRSKHESLVAFSNREFYDDELIVFPSPHEEHPDLGVKFVFVQGVYKNRVNIPEALAVVEQAQNFMHRFPDHSLGIVAMNRFQRDLIIDEMNRVVVHDKNCHSYRVRWEQTLEPFFIKNLENVQGDERSVIFISGVYGPRDFGQMPMQNFGPINQIYGHRRLNVLFTRARNQVRFFSSLKPEDVRVTESSSWGVKALRGYLNYAFTGKLQGSRYRSREPDSDFEIWVRERLVAIGYEVDCQVGVAGYYIDLAVRHPDYPSIYLVGIECDGATYHSSKSARDRDRLRQEILEALGWKLYRVWSTDWFRQPKVELEKLVRIIEEYKNIY